MHFSLRSRKNKLVAGGAGAAVLALVATGAIAYYSQSSATANAAAASAPTITITGVDAPTGLVPGGAAKPIQVHLKNETSDPQTVGQVHVEVRSDFFTKARRSDLDACTPSDFDITQAAPAGQLGAGETYTVAPTIAMRNAPTDQENCKGADIPLVVTFA